MASLQDHLSAARAALPETKLFIDGRWTDGVERSRLTTFDPATGQVVAEVAAAGPADVAAAVAAARRAFDALNWRRMLPAERERLLLRIAELLERDSEIFALLESLDNGKPLHVARRIDVPAAIGIFRYFAGWPTKLGGESYTPSFPVGRHIGYARRQPLGVVGQIIPWNVPLLMAAMKIAPALAAGCTIVLKPAEQTPLTALRLAQLLAEAGLPAGVVNIINGPGDVTGAALVAAPGIDKITFTGSTNVGRAIAASCGRDLKRVSLELGGKSPTIIFADADLDRALPAAANSIFINSGQVCFAGSRLFVERSVYGAVVERMAELADELRLGHGLDEDTHLGPLVSGEQLDRVSTLVERGRSEGVRIVTGGARSGDRGYFFQPTIVADAPAGSTLLEQEVFGPVLAVVPFDDEGEVVALANDTPFGLTASVWTRDGPRSHRLAEAIDAGVVWLNCEGVVDPAQPFGGFKASGIGRENGFEGLRHYLEHKSVCLRLD